MSSNSTSNISVQYLLVETALLYLFIPHVLSATNSKHSTLLHSLWKVRMKGSGFWSLFTNVIGKLLGITIVNFLALLHLNRKLRVLEDFQLTKIAHYMSI